MLRRASRRRVRAGSACAAAVAICGVFAGAAAGEPAWRWFTGDSSAHVGGRPGGSIAVVADESINAFSGYHLRFRSKDGVVRFGRKAPADAVQFLAYYVASSERTPIEFGSARDGQDLVPLTVVGAPRQRSALQSWNAGAVKAALGAGGRLWLGGTPLAVRVRGDRVELLVTLPGGKTQVLARGTLSG